MLVPGKRQKWFNIGICFALLCNPLLVVVIFGAFQLVYTNKKRVDLFEQLVLPKLIR